MFGGSFSGHQHPGNGFSKVEPLLGEAALQDARLARPTLSDAVTVPGFNKNGTNGTGKTCFFPCFFRFFW